MKYLVTGGAGFIGSHVVEALVEKGDVVVLDNLSFGNKENLSHISSERYTFIEGDIRKKEDCDNAVKDVDVIIHLGALRAVAPSVDNPDAYFQNNVEGTRTLLESAVKAGVKKIVFASSSSVYGDKVSFPTKEDDVVDPLSPYAETKLQTEKDLADFKREKGLDYVILRFFTVFGPRQDPKSKYAMAIPIFINKLLNKEKPIIFGDGEQSRDFTYVKNVVQACILAAESEKANNQVFNVANGKNTSINALVKMLKEIIGVDIENIYEKGLSGESRQTFADISKIKEVLGYEPGVSFEEGLKKAVDYFKNL